MLVTIQFPFADARRFIQNSGRLHLPGWPLPTPDSEFVRSFGSIRIRKCGGVGGWIGENEICEADRAIRFCNNLSLVDHILSLSIVLRSAFRRFYFDGWAVGKYEVGICPKESNQLHLDRIQCRKLINHIAQLPVCIKNDSTKSVKCELLQAGKELARLYAKSTTKHSSNQVSDDAWVRPGLPLMFLHYEATESVQIPFWAKPVPLSKHYGMQLFHCLFPYSGSNIRLWILGGSDYFSRPKDSRTLRICLLRLHAEHECLRLILRALMASDITTISRTKEADDLQHYLNTATARIGKLENQSAKHFDSGIVELARESLNIISPGQREALLNTLERLDIRKNIFRKVENYADYWMNVNVTEVQQMGDTYNIKQAGAVGPNAKAKDMVFNQINTQTGETIDLANLAQELSVLRARLKEEAVEPEHDKAIGAVAEAEIEAKRGNGEKVLEYLSKAGKWAFDVATKIGTTIAASAIKASLGLK